MPLATPPSAVQGQIISHDKLCCFQSIFHSFSPALNEPRMGKSLRSQLHHPLRLGFADALSRGFKLGSTQRPHKCKSLLAPQSPPLSSWTKVQHHTESWGQSVSHRGMKELFMEPSSHRKNQENRGDAEIDETMRMG